MMSETATRGKERQRETERERETERQRDREIICTNKSDRESW